MIQRLYINNLRCLVNFELDFTDLPSSLIVGQNGTGKSSIIDALDIITNVGLGRRSIQEAIPDTLFSRLPTMASAGHRTPPLMIDVSVRIAKDIEANYLVEFEWPIQFEAPRIKRENLTVNKKPVFIRELSSTSFFRSNDSKDVSFPVDWHISAISVIHDPHEKHPLRLFKNWLNNILILRPIPEHMAGSSRLFVRNLEPDTKNIADWYRWLLNEDSEQGFKVVSSLRRIWPDLKSIKNEQIGPTALDLHFEFGDIETSAFRLRLENLSEGEKILFLWACVLAWSESNPYSVCIWDEIGNHVALAEIQDTILRLQSNKNRNTQLIATGHLSEVIQSFSRESTIVLRREGRTTPTLPPKLASELDLQTEQSLATLLARGEEL
jgi:predicted ATPase